MKGLGKILLLILFLCGVLGGGKASAEAPFFARLKSQLGGSAYLKKNPGMNRLTWMRLYFPSTSVAERKGFWTRLYESFSAADKQRALAFYLFQMYVSSAAYGGEIPARLDINYLGVLDALERVDARFDLRKAETFYQKNKPEIKQWLAQFFHRSGLPAYDPKDPKNDATERGFLRALAASTYGEERAGYSLARPRWKTTFTKGDWALLNKVRANAQKDISQKVVLYEESDLGLYTAGHGSSTGYLYRPAAKECAACTYLTCGRVCQMAKAKPSDGLSTARLYQLQVRSKSGMFVQPLQGDYFVSPDGKEYPDWYYHEAVLIVLHRGGRFVPAVLDPFLADKPISLEAWLDFFAPADTLLYAYPFQRWNDTEERLVRPDERAHNTVRKNGHTYEPYPAEY